ncbi:hypothetical protein RF11_00756 [Thelohanellus kitauei]|uniref:Uncharacterized protein n=1 Tax=Thelohanellus kitauei TaxID=669202 RepID=A0A0C2MU50_THEKT|nr:hypothetical protein RF11_00756 [Thelohanellus kitauei]
MINYGYSLAALFPKLLMASETEIQETLSGISDVDSWLKDTNTRYALKHMGLGAQYSMDIRIAREREEYVLFGRNMLALMRNVNLKLDSVALSRDVAAEYAAIIASMAFSIAKAILDRSNLNASNAVTAINMFTLSYLWLIAPMLQLFPMGTAVMKEKKAATFPILSLLNEGQSTGRLFLPFNLTAVLHQMLKILVALIDSPTDVLINDTVRLMQSFYTTGATITQVAVTNDNPIDQKYKNVVDIPVVFIHIVSTDIVIRNLDPVVSELLRVVGNKKKSIVNISTNIIACYGTGYVQRISPRSTNVQIYPTDHQALQVNEVSRVANEHINSDKTHVIKGVVAHLSMESQSRLHSTLNDRGVRLKEDSRAIKCQARIRIESTPCQLSQPMLNARLKCIVGQPEDAVGHEIEVTSMNIVLRGWSSAQERQRDKPSSRPKGVSQMYYKPKACECMATSMVNHEANVDVALHYAGISCCLHLEYCAMILNLPNAAPIAPIDAAYGLCASHIYKGPTKRSESSEQANRPIDARMSARRCVIPSYHIGDEEGE